MKKDDYAEYLFGQGTNFRSYDYFGAHIVPGGTVFRVWAPNADMVYLTGDFTGWDTRIVMEKNDDGGVWSCLLENKYLAGCRKAFGYKYIIERNGIQRYKSDPFAFFSETLSNTASLFFNIDRISFEWSDCEYLNERNKNAEYFKNGICLPKPVNIYEVNLASWKKKDGSYLTYNELAEKLSEYVSDMGYTHIELMPVAEHPYDGSWGYQICGYYAPTSRFGSPEDFMRFVDKMHSKGIGVILDWVPAHFPKDEHGLFEFDGSPLYEYQGKDRMENRSWGTRCFDVGRTQVQSFLISNALFWFEKYHIDGLRVDAVSSMLYLDYDREPGEWYPNPDGSNINKQAVEFFKKLNKAVDDYFPDCMMIAEESTSFSGLTSKNGLGFDFKWNMGWMNDSLKYIKSDPVYRASMHNKLTFPLVYAFSENYILPISHDEVVHGKKSLIDKMFGSYEQKFSAMRAYLAYMMTHPGKKLMFMGSEFAQFREWDEWGELEWFMLDYENHSKMKDYIKTLNHFYKNTPALWEDDKSWNGFSWIFADRSNDNVLAYTRTAKNGDKVITVVNFSAVVRKNFFLPVDSSGSYKVIVNSCNREFGGGMNSCNLTYNAQVSKTDKKDDYGITIDLEPLSAVILISDK